MTSLFPLECFTVNDASTPPDSPPDNRDFIPIQRSAEIIASSKRPRFDLTGLKKAVNEVECLRSEFDNLCIVVASQSKTIDALTQVASEFKRVTDDLTTAVNALSSQRNSSSDRTNADDPPEA
jgi:hypothetical protein